jgi:hypothetical protein
MEARRARHSHDPAAEAFYLGYASGLTEAYHGARRDPAMQVAKDDYARGYSAGYGFITGRGDVGSRALAGMGRPSGRQPLFASLRRPKRKARKGTSRKSRRTRRR